MPVLAEYNLAGRVAILATAGGGEAPFLAQALAEAGASVFAVARRQSLLEPVLDALASYPGTHGGVAADIGGRHPEALAQAMAAFDQIPPSPLLRRLCRASSTSSGQRGVRGDFPRRLDILVNDARSMFAQPATDITGAQWDEVQSRNARATFLLCQEAGRRMIQRQYGRIVNVVSGLAERGMVNGSAFAASQAAVLSLTRSLAVEWGTSNIRVNALGTGNFITEDVPLEVQREELLVRYTPLRRKGHPRDIGPLLVYLCSEACDYSTGQPVYVDGGLNAHP
jgi:NAD(P)-dependent dehydrogenase (short-subunit alcohol dehydrogenase family)